MPGPVRRFLCAVGAHAPEYYRHGGHVFCRCRACLAGWHWTMSYGWMRDDCPPEPGTPAPPEAPQPVPPGNITLGEHARRVGELRKAVRDAWKLAVKDRDGCRDSGDIDIDQRVATTAVAAALRKIALKIHAIDEETVA